MIRSRKTRLRSAIVAAGVGTSLVAVTLVGSPAATAAAPVSETAGAAAAPAPRYDVDGDGVTDRLERTTDGTTRIVLSGTRTASPFTVGQNTDAENRPKDIVPVGNLYGTSAPDLLALWSNGELTAHEASGTGGTTYRYPIGAGWQMFNKILSPGDVTGDGRPDVLGRTPEGVLYIYRSNGTSGFFGTRAQVGSGWQTYDQLVGTGDVDGDRIGDILGRTVAGDLYFYKGTGSSTGAPFRTRVKVGYGFQMFNQLIVADDLNVDGRADFLARTPDGAVYRYLASGGGKFAPRTVHSSGAQSVRLYAGGGGVPAYGKHELVTIDGNNDIRWWPTPANGRLGTPVPSGTYHKGYFEGTLSSALDEKDRAHLVEIGPGYAWAEGVGYLGQGEEWNRYWTIAGPGDLTGDGKGDVVGLGFDGSLYLHKSRKDVSTQPLDNRVRVGGGWGVYDLLVSGGDHSGDGRPDLIARKYNGELYLYKGTGSATAPFATRVLIGGGWNTYTHLASPGDMTGDGRADLIGVNGAGDVYRYTATGRSGTSTFAVRAKIASGWQGYEYVT